MFVVREKDVQDMEIKVIKAEKEWRRDSYEIKIEEHEYQEILDETLAEFGVAVEDITTNVSFGMWQQCTYNGYTYGSTPKGWLEWIIPRFTEK